jgi:hypothetical protein
MWTRSLHSHSLTELSPSWEAENCAATQEPPSILWNPKVHYRVHESPTLIHILRQINPGHSIPSSKIHFNIVHSPTSWSSQWALSFWLSHQCPISLTRRNLTNSCSGLLRKCEMACRLLPAGYLLVLLFNTEDGGNMLLRNVGELLWSTWYVS